MARRVTPQNPMSNSYTPRLIQTSVCLATCLFLTCGCAQRHTVPAAEPASTASSHVTTGVGKTNTPSPQPQPALETAKKPVLPPGAAKPPAPFEGEGWREMFDGVTLEGWKETQFAGRGEVECVEGVLLLNMGNPFTGVNYTNAFPTNNYEMAFDAMRVMGSDFFCGFTFPAAGSHCSLIVGGWGGSLVGISSLDGMDASENETTKYVNFESGRWYRLRLRVTNNRIEVWMDAEKLIDVSTRDRKVGTRPGDIELSMPIGLASWQSTGAYREIKVRPVSEAADARRKGF